MPAELLQPGARRRQGGDPALSLGGGLLLQLEVLVLEVRGNHGERVELALEGDSPCPGSLICSSMESYHPTNTGTSRYALAFQNALAEATY